MVRLVFLGIMLIAGMISSCGENNDAQNTNTSTTTITSTTTTTTTTIPGQLFTSLQKSSNITSQDNMETPHVIVIRNETDFSAYWLNENAFPGYSPMMPVVNFNDNLVLYLLDGAKSMGGYHINITSVEPTPSGVIVHANQEIPGRGCVMIATFTQPYQFVSTPVFSGEATLVLSDPITVDCPVSW